MPDYRRADRFHTSEPGRIGHTKEGHSTGKGATGKRATGKETTGKWIEATAEMSAADVAYEALRLRLGHVERMLPLAAYHYAEDPEHVHRLRVGCRRAAAALSAFRPLIEGKVKPVRRWLRRLRGAAGPARDVDVLLLELQKESATGAARLRYLLEPFQCRREQLQWPLVDIAKRAQVQSRPGRLRKVFENCLDSTPHGELSGGISFGPYAVQSLSATAEKMLQMGEDLLTAGGTRRSGGAKSGDRVREGAISRPSLPSIERMHQLRIASKQFRYSIELFHGAFPASMQNKIYPQIEEIQQRLGTLNDHASIQQQFQWLMATPIPADRVVDLAARIVQQVGTVQDARHTFLDWWTPERIDALRAELNPLLSGQPNCYTTSR